jgi:hypothetical protein
MKELVELDEDDIIRALSIQITREKGWGESGHAGVVTLTITAATPVDGIYPGTPAKVSARVEKVAATAVENGKVVPVTGRVW